MEFKGAVKVEKERLEQFLTIWNEHIEYYEKQSELSSEMVNNWWDKTYGGGRFTRWWYKDRKTLVSYVRSTADVYVDPWSFTWSFTWDLLQYANLLPKRRRWGFLMRYVSEANEIKALYGSGSDIYLSSSQARLVNYCLEIESLSEVLKKEGMDNV